MKLFWLTFIFCEGIIRVTVTYFVCGFKVKVFCRDALSPQPQVVFVDDSAHCCLIVYPPHSAKTQAKVKDEGHQHQDKAHLPAWLWFYITFSDISAI